MRVFTEREKLLITNGLYMLECACRSKELGMTIKEEFGGTPDPEKVRQLMDEIRFEPQRSPREVKMSKYKVTMVCKEISRVEITLESTKKVVDPEVIKDRAWAVFDTEVKKGNVILEQVNSTVVEKV